jgi:hypothetical protein
MEESLLYSANNLTMKRLIVLLILLNLSGSSLLAQAAMVEKRNAKHNWRVVGKCEGDSILQKQPGKDKWRLAGKFDSNLIYEKRGKDTWKIVGKYHDGLIYEKSTGKDAWRVTGKYENGTIYEKRSNRNNWRVIGKHEECEGGAAFLLLLLDENDSGFVPVF